MKITLELIIEALDHASYPRRRDITEYLDRGLGSWAGIGLGEIVQEHIESLEGDTSPTQQELDEESGFKRGE